MKKVFVTTLSSAMPVGALAADRLLRVRERDGRDQQEQQQTGGEEGERADHDASHRIEPRGMPALQRERRDDGIEIVRLDRPERAQRPRHRRDRRAASPRWASSRPIRRCACWCSRRRAPGPSARAPTSASSSTRAGGVARMERVRRALRGARRVPRARRLRVRGQLRRRGRRARRGQRPARRRRQPEARLGGRAARRARSARRGWRRSSGWRARRTSSSPAASSGCRRRSRWACSPAPRPRHAPRRRPSRWRREIAAHPPEGLRRLKAMFRDLDATPERVAHENELLTRLPAGGRRAPGRRRAESVGPRPAARGGPLPLERANRSSTRIAANVERASTGIVTYPNSSIHFVAQGAPILQPALSASGLISMYLW